MSLVFLVLAAAATIWPSGRTRRRLSRATDSAGDTPWTPARMRNALRDVPADRAACVVILASGLAAVLTGWTVALAALCIGMTGVRRYSAQRRGDRTERDRGELADAMDVLIAELRVGAHPGNACRAAAQESSGEVSRIFAEAASRAALGGSVAGALHDRRGALHGELERIAGAWTLAEHHGAAMGELLESARRDVLGRRNFGRRVAAGMAGARATASVLALLPVLGIGLGESMGARPLGILFGGGLGGMLLVAGCVLDCAGLLWVDRIVRRVIA